MNPHKFLQMLKMLLISALLIITGCTISSPASTPPGKSQFDISTVVSRTPLTPTPLATLTLTSTPGVTPIPTERSTTPETSVAIPTPPGSQISRQALWLYETNNGCQLPCWWGITPGQTEWPVAEEFLDRFDQDIYRASSTPGLAYYGVSIPLPTQVFAEDHTELGISVRDDVVEFINTRVSMGDTPPGYLSEYTLSAFLTTYGLPTEVSLSTYSQPPGGGPGSDFLPFVVVLFYPDKGIAALYYDNGVKQENVVSGCPQQRPVTALSLWSPTQDVTIEKVISGSAVFNGEYLSLEEATEMDPATFYETFKNPDNTTCLETPADLWR